VRLLIAEDNEKLSLLMKRLLSENGFAVDCVATTEDAMSAFEMADYDLIVLDLSLLDKDGTEFLKSLRKSGHATPVLVATARSDVGERVRLLNIGADDYIVAIFARRVARTHSRPSAPSEADREHYAEPGQPSARYRRDDPASQWQSARSSTP
jgi:DNA-binding response OmpR family regulator